MAMARLAWIALERVPQSASDEQHHTAEALRKAGSVDWTLHTRIRHTPYRFSRLINRVVRFAQFAQLG
jgi:hypothetical protein